MKIRIATRKSALALVQTRWVGEQLRALQPGLEVELVVSEPLGDLKGAWRAVPEATSVLIEGGREELRPFTPAGPRPGRSGATATGG